MKDQTVPTEAGGVISLAEYRAQALQAVGFAARSLEERLLRVTDEVEDRLRSEARAALRTRVLRRWWDEDGRPSEGESRSDDAGAARMYAAFTRTLAEGVVITGRARNGGADAGFLSMLTAGAYIKALADVTPVLGAYQADLHKADGDLVDLAVLIVYSDLDPLAERASKAGIAADHAAAVAVAVEALDTWEANRPLTEGGPAEVVEHLLALHEAVLRIFPAERGWGSDAK